MKEQEARERHTDIQRERVCVEIERRGGQVDEANGKEIKGRKGREGKEEGRERET